MASGGNEHVPNEKQTELKDKDQKKAKEKTNEKVHHTLCAQHLVVNGYHSLYSYIIYIFRVGISLVAGNLFSKQQK